MKEYRVKIYNKYHEHNDHFGLVVNLKYYKDVEYYHQKNKLYIEKLNYFRNI